MSDTAKITLVVVVLAAAVLWYLRDSILPPQDEPVTTTSPAATAPPEPRGPIHPIDPPVRTGAGDLVPLPPLDDSDSYFLLELTDIFGTGVGRLLVSDALIDKFVATVDNLPRGHVAEAARPVGRLADTFIADSQGDSGPYYLSPENYARYDVLVRLIAGADLDAVNDMYRRYYPLFQESYERLGYPNAYFNDRVVQVIDHLLATPVREDALELVRPNVLYEFADPDLEALSSGQKLLLRIGPDHAERIKQVLTEFRALVAADGMP